MAFPNPPKTWATDEVVTATMLNTELRDALLAVLPIGTYILRAAAYTTVETAVEGRWLQCNGVAVSRTTYSLLFDYLNSLTPALPFGVGNGTTTFNLPDARGRIAVAEGEHTSVDDMGESDGADIANRRPQHYHNAQFAQNPDTSHPPGAPYITQGGSAVSSTYPTTPGSASNILNAPAHIVLGSYYIKYV